MLSLHAISSAGQAESYYQTVNDYYAPEEELVVEQAEEDPEQDSSEGGEPGGEPEPSGEGEKVVLDTSPGDRFEPDNGEHLRSAFLGKGAEILGLSGFDKKRFGELLRGRVSDSQTLGRITAAGVNQHRPGWDATLSAPKSVSLMALVGKDARIIDAHHEAVAETIKHLEGEYTFTRDNSGKWQKTDNLTVASFTHSASRNLDPQLHTHNVIMNQTLTDSGQWRSLEPNPIFQDQKHVGKIYRSLLAYKLSKNLGYTLRSEKDGAFEIKGVPKDLINRSSTRSAEIDRIAKEKGLEGAKGREQAALMTRSAKKSASRASLEASWQHLAKDHLPALNKLMEDSKEAIESPSVREEKAKEEALYDMKLAVKHLTTYEAVVTKKELCSFALQNVSGSYSYDYLPKALDKLLENKTLIPSLAEKDSYTTKSAWEKETKALTLMEQGKGFFPRPVLSQRAISSHINNMEERSRVDGLPAPNRGQQEGIKLVLGTKDQFVGIQGYAGVGKTFLWREARQLAEAAKHKVRGFTPTGLAAEKLEKESGIPSQTLDSFIYRNKSALEGGKALKATNEIWVVDEAGLSNGRQVLDLMFLARRSGARVVFQGDGKQLGAIEWGKFFKLLQNNGMSTASVTEILRQKGEVREAVYDVTNKDYSRAITNLGGRVIVEEKSEKRIQALVKQYMALPADQRRDALVVIPDLETRALVTKEIREALQNSGDLAADQHSASILKDAKLSDPQKGDGRYYEEGMLVEFGRKFKSIEAEKGDRFTVMENGEKGSVALRSEKDGRRVDWNPMDGGSRWSAVGVFKQERVSLAPGDELKWTRTNQDLGMRNGSTGTIKSLDREKNTMTVEWERGGEKVSVEHDLSRDRNFDHNYVKTAFVSQGLDSRNVLTISESWRRNLINEKSFYVKLSRTKENIWIYTDDKAKLTKAISRQGEKTSALESQQGVRYKGKDKELSVGWVEKLIQKARKVAAQRSPSRTPDGEKLFKSGALKNSQKRAHEQNGAKGQKQSVGRDRGRSRGHDAGH